jgi:DNA-binding transcriptional regulator/RsmH inhibitor MraZ
MLLLPNDDNFKDGFCWELFEATVDEGPRIRLPRAIIRVFEKNKVEMLWLYSDPTGPRLILCPEQNRQTYLKLAQQNLPKSIEEGKAYRHFICSGRGIEFRHHGRVSIASINNKNIGEKKEFQVQVGGQVVIVGVGLWYELWLQDDWFNNEQVKI